MSPARLVRNLTVLGTVIASMALVGGVPAVAGRPYRSAPPRSVIAGPADSTVLLGPRSGPPTTTVSVTATGYAASENVEIDFAGAAVGQSTSDPNGDVTASFTVPASAKPGTHQVAVTGASSGITGLASFVVRTNWPDFQFDLKNSGYNPYENVLSPSKAASLKPAWSFDTFFYIESSPVVVNGTVFVGSDDKSLYAFNARTGAKKWSFKTGYWVKSPPAVAHEIVYVGSNDGNVYALNAKTGALVWSQNVTYAVEGAPTVAHGMVYVGTAFGGLFGLDAKTGDVVWTHNLTDRFYSSAAVVGDTVYIGGWSTGKLYKLAADTGDIEWSVPTNCQLGTPVLAGSTVYLGCSGFGSAADGVVAVSAASGKQRWFAPTGDYVESAPAVANGVVYAGSLDDRIYAINASTGAQQWSFLTEGGILSSPAVANGLVFDASLDGSVYALNTATGKKVWSYDTGFAIISSPAVVDGRVYIGSDDGKVRAFALP